MHSLQNRIFFFFVVLLISVQSIALWTIYRATNEQSQQSINTRLTNSSTIFKRLFQSRSEKLSAIAQTAAQDGGLRENFYEDERSFLFALNNHRKRIKADLAIAIDEKGTVKAQLVSSTNGIEESKVSRGPEVGQNFTFLEWLDLPGENLLYPLADQLYQISIAPVKSGAENIGWIAFGFQIDQRLAKDFASLTSLTTDFIIQSEQKTVYLAWSDDNDRDEILLNKLLSGETENSIIHTVIDLGKFDKNETQSLRVVLHGSRDDFLAAIQQRWIQFLGLATIILLLSLGGAYIISAGITKPIKHLVSWAKFIAKGNYDVPVMVADKSEIGQLAHEFAVMQQEIINREKTISHSAFHDALTSLPNRNSLVRDLNEKIRNDSTAFGLFLVNISHIKDVNNSLGHKVGDQVIKEVARRLSEIREMSLPYHIGADEFVLLANINHEKEILAYAHNIKDVLNEPYINEAMNLKLNARSGIATFPEQASQAEELLQKADTAMHIAKVQKVRVQVYEPGQEINTLERLNLMNDLSIAIKENQLILYYQPKVTLATNFTETVEALVRWRHPKLGLVPPDKFISIAEKTGQINPLTLWVIEEAVNQYSQWQKKGIKLVIAVNISAENLKADNFFENVCEILQRYKTPVDAIMLEITESAVVDDPAKAIRLLMQFRERGFILSIDDYGTGYSSLAQLKDLPVDELKIDMSFILRLPQDKGDKIIVRSTIELAHNMGLTVVAEGVENEQAMIWLTEQGCEKAQGYFISRPLPADDFESWLLNSQYYGKKQVN